MKLIKNMVLLFGILIAGWSQASFATGAGDCDPTGGTINSEYDWGVYNIADPDSNVAGYVTPSHQVTSGVQSQTFYCSCSAGPYDNLWMFGDTTLTKYNTSGGVTYYNIPGNQYLAVGLTIWSAKRSAWLSLPFGPVSNDTGTDKTKYYCNANNSLYIGGTHSGSKAQISFEVVKPFIGGTYIINAVAGSLYWTIGDGSQTAHGGIAGNNYVVNGTITVPQNCVINAGTVISVDFGSLYSGDFKVAGQKPDDSPIKTFNVPIKCTNIAAPANLTLRVQATADTHYQPAIASDNPDVGVVVTNDQGTILNPNDTSSVVPFRTDSSGNANISLKAYPVSTTGKTPKEGIFTALAYLRVDFA